MSAPSEPTDSLVVPLTRLAADRVPPVCLKTGLEAQCLIPTVACTVPQWGWWLIVLGGAPYLAARRWIFAREDLTLPARNQVFERTQYLRQATVGLYAVVVIVAAWSIVTLNPFGVVVALAAGAAVTAGGLLLTPKVWVGAELDGTNVRLQGVHVGAARRLRD